MITHASVSPLNESAYRHVGMCQEPVGISECRPPAVLYPPSRYVVGVSAKVLAFGLDFVPLMSDFIMLASGFGARYVSLRSLTAPFTVNI